MRGARVGYGRQPGRSRSRRGISADVPRSIPEENYIYRVTSHRVCTYEGGASPHKLGTTTQRDRRRRRPCPWPPRLVSSCPLDGRRLLGTARASRAACCARCCPPGSARCSAGLAACTPRALVPRAASPRARVAVPSSGLPAARAGPSAPPRPPASRPRRLPAPPQARPRAGEGWGWGEG